MTSIELTTDFSLIWEETPFKNYQIMPSMTDNNIEDSTPHYVVLDESVELRNELLIFLPGADGDPLHYSLIAQEAARLGYHVINLSYPNDELLSDLCLDHPDPDCYEKTRSEILNGIDTSDVIEVDSVNSIENRLVKLLIYLDEQYPDRGWGQYLEQGWPNWDKIAVAGHSQGGAQAAYIAKQYEVARVVMFSPAVDASLAAGGISSWVSDEGATFVDRYYGFTHEDDNLATIARTLEMWDLLGLDDYGLPIDADDQLSIDTFSHQLLTDLPDDEPHGSIIVDVRTPLMPGGIPVYEKVWQYLLLGALSDVSALAGADQLTIIGTSANDSLYGSDGDNLIAGLEGDDQIIGNDGSNIIDGGLGDDQIFGNEGDDIIYGNSGLDVITGDEGSDTLIGGLGADSISGGLGSDQLQGGADDDFLDGHEDNDTLLGEDGNDFLNGSDGDDSLVGGIGADTLWGGLGSDQLQGGADDDFLDGHEDNDTLLGEDGNDFLNGSDGDDSLVGGIGADTLWGGLGSDQLQGGADDDFLDGHEDSDTLLGEDGNDFLNGSDGDDSLVGGIGADWLLGGLGVDQLEGDAGNDFLLGGDGNDILLGGDGSDFLNGEAGEDFLDGNLGRDQLKGGTGMDIFVLQPSNENDLIIDFVDGSDKLGLANGLTFEDLYIRGIGSYTIIGLQDNYEILATLLRVNSSNLEISDFV
jgi:Ca2+-binding RTX toxin-like protein/pimeloyl-ACP methyl ester carboxylesterase